MATPTLIAALIAAPDDGGGDGVRVTVGLAGLPTRAGRAAGPARVVARITARATAMVAGSAQMMADTEEGMRMGAASLEW